MRSFKEKYDRAHKHDDKLIIEISMLRLTNKTQYKIFSKRKQSRDKQQE